MTDRPRAGEPDYTVYRARRNPLSALRRRGDPLAQLRERERRGPRLPRAPGGITPRRVLKWLAAAVVIWIALSVTLFFVSAALQRGVSDRAKSALAGGGSMLGGSTILVLGADRRPSGTHEPGAGGPSRSDSIMLLHVSFGKVRKLSVLRDSYAEVPGHGPMKINAAYAFGGAALAIQTVEQFLGNGLRINHVIEIDFTNFPKLIDALGGVDVTSKTCIRSQPFGGRVFRLKAGTHHLNGKQALAFARVRENRCAPNEDDRARVRRQQQVLSGIRHKLVSPFTFFRLPWVSWNAPRTIRTDMSGPSLAALFGDLATGGTGSTDVLAPSGPGPAGSLLISEQAKRAAVKRLLGG